MFCLIFYYNKVIKHGRIFFFAVVCNKTRIQQFYFEKYKIPESYSHKKMSLLKSKWIEHKILNIVVVVKATIAKKVHCVKLK